jgi:hypothetical protein
MNKLEPLPYFDKSGNFVIPPAILGRPREDRVFLLRTDEQTLRVTVHQGAVVQVEQIDSVRDGFEDLLAAASTSMDFWDNPVDDEVWNRA